MNTITTKSGLIAVFKDASLVLRNLPEDLRQQHPDIPVVGDEIRLTRLVTATDKPGYRPGTNVLHREDFYLEGTSTRRPPDLDLTACENQIDGTSFIEGLHSKMLPNHGLGTALLEDYLQRLRRQGYKEVELIDSSKGVGGKPSTIYDRLGFKQKPNNHKFLNLIA